MNNSGNNIMAIVVDLKIIFKEFYVCNVMKVN